MLSESENFFRHLDDVPITNRHIRSYSIANLAHIHHHRLSTPTFSKAHDFDLGFIAKLSHATCHQESLKHAGNMSIGGQRNRVLSRSRNSTREKH